MPKRRPRQIKQLKWGWGEISGNMTAEKSTELMEDVSSDGKKYIKQQHRINGRSGDGNLHLDISTKIVDK